MPTRRAEPRRRRCLMAYIRRRNSDDVPRFDVCWREHGRDRSRTFTFRKDAERFRTDIERRAQLCPLYEAPPITLAAARASWKKRWQIGKADSTVQRKDEAWPHVQRLDPVPLKALTPAMLEDAIADAARVAPRQAQLALGTVKQVLRDAMKRGQRVDPALFEVKAPTYDEREPVFLSAAEVKFLASRCSEPRLITFAALSGLRLGRGARPPRRRRRPRRGMRTRDARSPEGRRGTNEDEEAPAGLSACARALKALRAAAPGAPTESTRARLPVPALGQRLELGQLPCRRLRQGRHERSGRNVKPGRRADFAAAWTSTTCGTRSHR